MRVAWIILAFALLTVPAQSAAGPVIAVFPFENQTGRPDLDWLGPGFQYGLTAKLGAVTRVTIKEGAVPDTVQGRLDRIEAWMEAGISVGASVLLSGAYCLADEGIEVSVRVARLDSGTVHAGPPFSGSPERLFVIQDRIAEWLLQQIGSPAGPGSEGVLSSAPTRSVEAFREWIAHRAAGEPKGSEASEKRLRRALELDSLYAEARRDLGVLLLSQERVSEAVAHLKEAARLRPGDARTHYLLGAAFTRAGNLEQALEKLQKSIQIDSGDADAHFSLGEALERMGRRREAVPAFRRAAELDPKYGDYHIRKGRTHLGAGEYRLALQAFETAGLLYPGDPTVRYNLGLTHFYLGDFSEAEAALTGAIAINSHYVEAHVTLGLLHKDRKRYAQAATCFRAAVALSPQYATAYMHLGDVLIWLGEDGAALKALKQAVVLDPKNADFRVYLGLLHARMGDRQAAIATLKKALELRPDHPEASGIREEIARLEREGVGGR